MNKIDLFSLNSESLVLTANPRLAENLDQIYAYEQSLKGNSTWETPQILSLAQWLQQLWMQNKHQYILVSDLKEQILWQKITQKNWSEISIIQEAWKLCHYWKIDLTLLKDHPKKTVRSFYQWINKFKTHCEELQWITEAELPQYFLNKRMMLPKKIWLVGFYEYPPTIQAFLQKIRKKCCIKIAENPKAKAQIERQEFETREMEIRAMAEWAKKENLKNSKAKIACVIQNLPTIRHQVEHIFLEIFSEKKVYNICSGKTLDRFPMIQAALKIICNDWISVLQSPFIATHDNDIELGAMIDKVLRKKNEPHISLKKILPIISDLKAFYPQTTLLKRLKRLLQDKKKKRNEETLESWIQYFVKKLKIIAWPGYRSLNSEEAEVFQGWIQALEALQVVSHPTKLIPIESAISLLKHHVESIFFESKSKNSSIQVLGLLETSGIIFDAIWMIGLNSENWPPDPDPNPYLPFNLQKKYRIPHSTAKNALEFSKNMQKRIISSTSKVILSSYRRDGEKRFFPSRLIVNYPCTNQNIISKNYNVNNHSVKFETYSDEKAPPISDNEKILGGTYILKLQALCPFKAYSTIRLHADALDKPTIGLSRVLQGKLMHEVLKRIWNQLKDQKILLKKSNTELDNMISKTISILINDLPGTKQERYFLNLEKKRLRKIIHSWMAVEKKRSPFSVLSTEVSGSIIINHLSFQCRIDRIDLTDEGKKIVIDYKLGLAQTHEWFTSRPSEPQLPIYCVFSNRGKTYDGIAFAQVKSGDMHLKLIGEENIGIPDWKKQTHEWEHILTNLSDKFYQGFATVDPLPNACNGCELKSLCRVSLCRQIS